MDKGSNSSFAIPRTLTVFVGLPSLMQGDP